MHPLAVGPVNPGLSTGRADQTGSAGRCQNLGPGRQIVSQDNTKRRQPNRRSDRDPVPLTLAPRPVTLGEAAPEALSTLSLPTMR